MTSLKRFSLSDIKTMHRLDHSLVDLLKGKRDFECPDIDVRIRSTADGYKVNDIEKRFTKKAQNYAMFNFFKYTAVGALAGYVLATRRPGAMLVSVSIGSVIGSTFGVTVATVGIMRRQLQLANSPVGLESRYQLWKIDQNHEWLDNHQDDVQRWNRMTYYQGTNDASIDLNRYQTNQVNIEDHIKQHLDRHEDKQRIIPNKETNANEEMRTQKRERFYENRQRLGDTQDHDHLYDYSHDHDKNKNTEHQRDPFAPTFDSHTDASVDHIDSPTNEMKWG
eukprot:559414_1